MASYQIPGWRGSYAATAGIGQGQQYDGSMSSTFGQGQNPMAQAMFGGAGAAPSFAAQQGALDKYFQLQTQQALQQAGQRANNLSAARGMHIDGGVSTQMEQELAADAMTGIRQQQMGANADLMARERSEAMERARIAEDRRRWDAQQRALADRDRWERDNQERLYRDMRRERDNQGRLYQDMRREGSTAPGSRPDDSNPFATGGNPWRDGQSSTGNVTGEPAVGSSWDTRLGSERGLWARPDRPGVAGKDYALETSAQAAERAASNPRSSAYQQGQGMDYSGASNNGGYQVPGLSPAGNPSGAFAGASAGGGSSSWRY